MARISSWLFEEAAILMRRDTVTGPLLDGLRGPSLGHHQKEEVGVY